MEITRLEDKVDKVTENLAELTTEVKVGFEKYNQLLDAHIEGVEQNRNSIKYINTHVHKVQGFLSYTKWFLGFFISIGTVVGLLFAVFKYLQ